MATSSSAKKVARVAAKSGSGSPTGAASAKQRNWLFALAIVAVVALGGGLIAYARSTNPGLGDNKDKPRANLADGKAFDHWHAAFAVNVCGKELSPLQDGATDAQGIHTHGEGLIHIHPFVQSASGKRATLQKYFDQVGFKVTDSGFRLPDGITAEGGGSTVQEGVTTCGGKPGELVLAHWKDGTTAAGTKPDKIFRSDFGGVQFTEDLGAYTLAFVPKGSTDIDPPASAKDIATLGACDGENPPPSCNTAGSGSATATVPPGSGG